MELNQAPFPLRGRRTLLLADGEFSMFGSKTANCYIRYRGDDVVAVLDGSRKGMTAEEVLGFGGAIPVVSTVAEAMAFQPEMAIVGTAPIGGGLSDGTRRLVTEALRNGLDIVSGLHVFLADDAALAGEAEASGARMWDVRYVPPTTLVSTGAGCKTGAKCVLVTGTDCNVGKMTTTVELFDEAVEQGRSVAWAATGQTGMMLRERGIAIDRVVADFIGGAAEHLVNFEGQDSDIVFVEGQGSLIHPGYAGVTLGLLYGVMPDCQVLVHAPARKKVAHTGIAMPPFEDLVELHETMMRPFKPSPVVAVAVNTAGVDPVAADDMISMVEEETGLPAADPVRGGAAKILAAVVDYLRL